jgi:GH24 family phage-related lysozyme (muramidase)
LQISSKGIELIRKFEGLRLVAYKAVSSELYYTIGYGHYGSDVHEGMVITENEADHLLMGDILKHEFYVNSPNYCEVIGQINQNQFDALVSFCFNCGPANLIKLTFGKSLKQIEEDIILYNKANGKVLEGLIRRRKAEQELFRSKDVLEVDDKVTDFIIAVLQDYWKRMDGNKEVQDYTHYVAEELRKATGRKE